MSGTHSEGTRHRAVIVGAGFGGLFAARALHRAPVDLTVVDRTNHHLFQPLLYQLATGILSAGQIAPATRDVLRRQANTSVVLGEVVDIDLTARVVVSELLGRRTLTPWDSLIVAAGAETSWFGHDDFAVHAPGLKSVDDALELRGRILGAFEMAELEPDPRRQAEWLTFVVVGGGATGVEMAGQIAELSRRTLRSDFRRIDPSSARVLLLDGGDRILPAFGRRLSGSAAAELRRLGVEIHLGAMVEGVDADGVDVRRAGGDGTAASSTRIAAKVKVWAAGVKGAGIGARVAEQVGVQLDRHGRIPVGPDCRLPGRDDVWVVGDLMALRDLPSVAEVAMQSGVHAAHAVRRRAQGRPDPGDFRYRDLGSMASVSRFHAVAEIGRLRVAGLPGWLLWLVVHLVFLTGFKNRLGALGHWTVSFLGRSRSERAFTGRQAIGG